MIHIPIHKLHDRTEKGLEIRHFLNGVNKKGLGVLHFLNDVDEEGATDFYAHRDDNYFFILVERGYGSMSVDFEKVELTERSVGFVAPGQVHYDAKEKECDYWYISAATSLIPKEYLEILENNNPFQKPQHLNVVEFEQCRSILRLLAGQCASNPVAIYYEQLTRELLRTFLCLVARAFAQNDPTRGNTVSRPQLITGDFRKLLKKYIRLEKSPSYYAGLLNISEGYLSEALKSTTGFTAGYWIRHNIILEAKRLLFHTEMNVKEIAHALGFDDHTYFSKLFKQSTQMTPLVFRDSYLK
jgi:AraC-like DNA-binding protein/mannose-6-phosphate isomerase-like protein (cupin superfamily)